MKIGIDIDNVISDSSPEYLKKFNDKFNTEVKYTEIRSYFFTSKDTGVEEVRISEFFDNLLIDEEFQVNIPPYPEALTVIRKWINEGYFIHYITARPEVSRKATEMWLKKYRLTGKNTTVDLFNGAKFRNDASYKKMTAKSLGIDLLIEDSREMARVMDFPVLLLDRPWNKGKLKKNIKRVKDWAEIEKFVAAF